MNTLQIRQLTIPQSADISKALDAVQHHEIRHALWVQPAVKPIVHFALAYTESDLCVKFKVREPQIKAVFRNTNDPVYRDSCVELFTSFGGDENYYNLEFNCMGTCLGQYGPDRNHRTFIEPALLNKIKADTKVGTAGDDQLASWELTLQIPFEVFGRTLSDFKESGLRLNLYKCGDDLEEPHFLAWNNIESVEPNFHLPAYFGAATLK